MTGRGYGHRTENSPDPRDLAGAWADDGAAGSVGRLGPEAMGRLASLGLTSAGLAHDMGNLLQVVASALHLIERSLPAADSSGGRRLCEDARTALDRILLLQGQILNLASFGSAVLGRVHPSAIIASLESLIALSLTPDIAFDAACDPDAPAIVCDVQELENVILNLVLNARDAMPTGGRLRLGCMRDAGVLTHGTPYAVFTVRDTGCGMSDKVQEQAFTPFFTTKSAGRGTGLGLPMVSDFARRAGGSVTIESELGHGTTVTLRLPGCRE